MRRRSLLVACIALISSASLANPILIPSDLSNVCTDLALVAYWGATEHLSKADKQNADDAAKNALAANRLRPKILSSRVERARSLGTMSHGNAGNGLGNLTAARNDGMLTAIYVFELCLKGEI